MDITLFSGRDGTDGRDSRETRVYDLLDSLGIEFTRADHPCAMTMEDCLEVDLALGTTMFKNLFLCNRQKTAFYLLLISGDKPFRTKEFSAALGISRVSFAGEEDMVRLLGLFPGSVSPMGLINDMDDEVQLVIDKDLLKYDILGCHPCVNTSSISLRTTDLLEKFLPEVKHSPIFIELAGED